MGGSRWLDGLTDGNDGAGIRETDVVRSGTSPFSVVTGAGGFIGGHLTRALTAAGHAVRAVDIKPLDDWYQICDGAENIVADLAQVEACRRAAAGVTEVYHLAADMGGMGFISAHKADCMLSVLPSTQMLLAARDAGVERFFFASSACVYAAGKQTRAAVTPLREEDAYPAMPEDGYGWEKLFTERMCHHFLDDFGLEVRVARYHNVYGPHGTWSGGREKAPAAVCRKVAQAVLTGGRSIEIWGDGCQTRSFMFIDDAVQGTLLICRGSFPGPVNLGSEETVTVNELVGLVEDIAGVRLERQYRLDLPMGVRGRSSDNTLIRATYGWAPSIPLQRGLERTYAWVFDQVAESVGRARVADGHRGRRRSAPA